jgi:hypothetical protein
MNLWIAAVVCLISATAGFLLFVELSPMPMLGMNETVGDEYLRMLAGFGATLVGVVLGAAYRELRRHQAAGRRRINIRSFFRDLRSSIELWLGLIGSPVVFALLLNSSEGMDLLGVILIGLQNGFCCLVILNAFIEKGAAPEQVAARG